MAIVDNIEWEDLDHTVETQQRNRETYSPAISLFRWWARRPHAVAGAILDAAKAEFGRPSFLVADPFSGGGRWRSRQSVATCPFTRKTSTRGRR
jgi:hypothetical protein